MKKGFIYLGAIITISLIAVVLAGTIYVLGKQTSPTVVAETNITIINSFINQWNLLQKQVEASPILGSTKWFVDDVQFISSDTFLAAIEDGHIMVAVVFTYNNDAFNYIVEFNDDFPFTQSRWQEIITQYGDNAYVPQNYSKQIVLNSEVINYDDWTMIPENRFVRSIAALSQCTDDSECKLIYSGCDCEAVFISDPRTYLESDLFCIRNGCMPPTEKAAVCENNKCVLKDK